MKRYVLIGVGIFITLIILFNIIISYYKLLLSNTTITASIVLERHCSEGIEIWTVKNPSKETYFFRTDGTGELIKCTESDIDEEL